MVKYLQIHNKGYLDILNTIVSEMVIGAEGYYRHSACFYMKHSKTQNYLLSIQSDIHLLENACCAMLFIRLFVSR